MCRGPDVRENTGIPLKTLTREKSLGECIPDGPEGKESVCGAGDTGDVSPIPGSGRSPGGGNGNPLQYSRLEKSHGQRSLADYSPRGRRVGHN